MLAGMVLFSILVGLLAMAAAYALALPGWIVLLCYPATGLLALLCLAAARSLRPTFTDQAGGLRSQVSHS